MAIIECIASIALYVGVGVYLGTLKYLAAAVIFAPLMLFRTEVSADWGLKAYDRGCHLIGNIKLLNRLPEPYNFAAGFLLFALFGTAIRIVATVYWALRQPLQTLRDTPQNWLRQSLCTDFAHPPEVVPLEATKGGEQFPTFPEVLAMLRTEVETSRRRVLLLILSPFIIVGWLPSIIYRVSFKATALAYTPFIWAAHATLKNPLSVKTRLERITKASWKRSVAAFRGSY